MSLEDDTKDNTVSHAVLPDGSYTLEFVRSITEEESEVLRYISHNRGSCKSDLSDCDRCPIKRLALSLEGKDSCLDLFFASDESGTTKTSYVNINEAYQSLASEMLADYLILNRDK